MVGVPALVAAFAALTMRWRLVVVVAAGAAVAVGGLAGFAILRHATAWAR